MSYNKVNKHFLNLSFTKITYTTYFLTFATRKKWDCTFFLTFTQAQNDCQSLYTENQQHNKHNIQFSITMDRGVVRLLKAF